MRPKRRTYGESCQNWRSLRIRTASIFETSIGRSLEVHSAAGDFSPSSSREFAGHTSFADFLLGMKPEMLEAAATKPPFARPEFDRRAQPRSIVCLS